MIDAVGMEAHGSPTAAFARRVTAHLPDTIAEPLMKKAGLDRLAAVYTAIETVRRGGTVSLSGVCGNVPAQGRRRNEDHAQALVSAE